MKTVFFVLAVCVWGLTACQGGKTTSPAAEQQEPAQEKVRKADVLLQNPSSELGYELIKHVKVIDRINEETPHPTAESIKATSEIMDTEVDEVMEAYRKGDETWEHFASLCKEERFKDAYDYYYSGAQGDILVAMRNSTAGFELYNYVIRFLDMMFDKYNVEAHLLNNLTKNIVITRAVVSMNGGEYVPDHYGELTEQLILLNTRAGNYDKALEMVQQDMYTALMAEGNSEEEAREAVENYCKIIESLASSQP